MTKPKLSAMLERSQKYSARVSHARASLRPSKAEQCQRLAGEFRAERQSWARQVPRQDRDRLEQRQVIAGAQFRLIFGVRDKQGRGRVRVMEVSG